MFLIRLFSYLKATCASPNYTVCRAFLLTCEASSPRPPPIAPARIMTNIATKAQIPLFATQALLGVGLFVSLLACHRPNSRHCVLQLMYRLRDRRLFVAQE